MPPTGDWMSFRELKNAMPRYALFQKRCEGAMKKVADTYTDLFDDLVHFTRVFPHRRLTLEVPLVDIEEWRYPGHGRRRRQWMHRRSRQPALGLRRA